MKNIKPRDFCILSIKELREWFHLSEEMIYVSSKIRKEWMINHYTLIKNGKVYDIDFTDKGGGVWLAQLIPY